MSYKKSMIVILLIIALCLMGLVVYFMTKEDQLNSNVSNVISAKLQDMPKFEDYPVDSMIDQADPRVGLDFSNAPEASKYSDVFLENRENGKNVLAATYRIVSLPCEGDEIQSDCYTLWTYNIGTGHVIKIGKNHYFPTEVHLDSRLIKTGDESYVLEGNTVRLVYVK